MRTAPLQRVRGRQRLAAGLLAIAFLLAGVFGEALHVALEVHTWCHVHEMLEHGSEPGRTAGLEEDHGEHEASADLRVGAGPAAGETHERCSLSTLSRDDDAVVLGAGVGRPGAAPSGRAFVPRERSDAAFGPRYRLAPKQSPPVG